VNLDRDQVTAAELAGCQFREANPAEVQRYAMQRRIFFIEGRPHLALRSDGFCETVGTLEPLIAYGRARLASQAPADAPIAAPSLPAGFEPEREPAPAVAAPAPEAPSLGEAPAATALAEPAPAPKRRGRPPKIRDANAPPPVPKRRGRPPKAPAAPPAPTPVVTAPSLPPLAVEPLLRAAIAPTAKRRSAQPEAPRWLTAGASRRGRSAVHWTTRRG
jgi:hypothetical protein